MTEQEAVERLKCMRLFMQIEDDKNECKFLEDDYIANDMAIKALEEIQQYRALGTVDELKSMKENGAFTGVELAQLAAMQMRLKKYESIGTVEELRVARDKQVAKKPPFIKRSFTQFYVCPGCSNAEHYEKLYSKMPYCFKCGQKLDWSDEDENNG